MLESRGTDPLHAACRLLASLLPCFLTTVPQCLHDTASDGNRAIVCACRGCEGPPCVEVHTRERSTAYGRAPAVLIAKLRAPLVLCAMVCVCECVDELMGPLRDNRTDHARICLPSCSAVVSVLPLLLLLLPPLPLLLADVLLVAAILLFVCC